MIQTKATIYQWDTGLSVIVDSDVRYVDYWHDNEIYRVETVTADGQTTAPIPDEMLQTAGVKLMWACHSYDTKEAHQFVAVARPQPPGYIYTPTEHITFETLEQDVRDAIAEMQHMAETGELYPPAYIVSADVDDGTLTLVDQDGQTIEFQGGGTEDVVAPAYSDSDTYAIGDLVIRETLLYKAIEDITAPETWTSEHWQQTSINAILKDYNQYGALIITCLTQDGVTVTGQTVTIRRGSHESDPIYTQIDYDGQPISVSVPKGFNYFVSVSDTLQDHFNPTTASGIINVPVLNVTLTYSDAAHFTVNTFKDIKVGLNHGINLSGYIGEQVTAMRQNTPLSFDIVDYDATKHSVTLLLHDTMPTPMAFDSPQALAWFENGLAAGDYCFTNVITSKAHYFTLTKPIPEGGQLRANTTIFETYESQDATEKLESGSTSETVIAGAVSLGTTRAGDLNDLGRASYGSSNVADSGLFAWLNSDALPNTNLPRANKFSRPYSSGLDGGFLNGFDAESLAVIDDTEWTIQSNTSYEAPASMGGIAVKGESYTVTGKFGLANAANIRLDLGTAWDLYVDAQNADRIKYYNGAVRTWWTFKTSVSAPSYEFNVNAIGNSSADPVNYMKGIVPACIIKKDVV